MIILWIILVFNLLLICYVYVLPLFLNNYANSIDKLLNSNIIQPVAVSHPEWLQKSLSDFYINTSHNSYLSSYQNISFAKYDSIMDAINMGARCIELDIRYTNNKLIVAHGNKTKQTSTSLDLDKCLDIINIYGFKTSDPLILCLEIYLPDNKSKKELSELIKKKFEGRLLPKYQENKISNTPFYKLLNKLIIISTNDINDLEDIIDISTNDYVNIDTDITINPLERRMIRIYPAPGIKQHLSMNYYDPDDYWNNYNVSMVAFNFQRYDKNLYKNIQKFKNNSFILKE